MHQQGTPMSRANSNLRGERKCQPGKKGTSRKGLKVEDDILSDTMAGVLYLTTHSEKPEVQVLAKKANIDLSGFSGPVGPAFCDLSDSVKALVSMGLDTDENLTLMFGDPKSVRNMQQEFRMGMLFGEPLEEGSGRLNETDPTKPANANIMQLLPCWQRSLTTNERDDHCSICQEQLSSPAQALHGCMHLFHPPCITNWLTEKSTCPVCRKALPLHAPRPASTQELELIDRMSTMH